MELFVDILIVIVLMKILKPFEVHYLLRPVFYLGVLLLICYKKGKNQIIPESWQKPQMWLEIDTEDEKEKKSGNTKS